MASDDILTLFEKVSRFCLLNIPPKTNPPSTARVIFLLGIVFAYFLNFVYQFEKNASFDCFVEEIACAYDDCFDRQFPCVEHIIFYSGIIIYKLLAATALCYNELISKNFLFEILQNLNAINNNFVNYLSMKFPLRIYGYVIFSFICLRLGISFVFICRDVYLNPHIIIIIQVLVEHLFGYWISIYFIIEFVLLLILNKQLNLMSKSVKKCHQAYRLMYLQIFETHCIFDNFFSLSLLSGVFFLFGTFLNIGWRNVSTDVKNNFTENFNYLILPVVQVSAVIWVGNETKQKVSTSNFLHVKFFFGNFQIIKIIAQ